MARPSPRTGRSRTRTTTSLRWAATVREVLRTSGVDPADVVGVGIDFTACTMLPTTADGTPLCRLPDLRAGAARVGQAVEASRGAARGGPDQRAGGGAGRAVAAAVRRPHLVGVVPRQVAPDPRRGTRGLRRRGSAHRGRGLGRVAADGRRDPQQLHGRLQGTVVATRGLPERRLPGCARPTLRGPGGHAHVARRAVDRRPCRGRERRGRQAGRAPPRHARRHRQRGRPRVGARRAA